jgi:hypothetical protein
VLRARKNAMTMQRVSALDDGTYDAMVIDATTIDDATAVDSRGATATRIELVITSGAHKGEALDVTAHGLARDPLDLLGVSAKLTVREGTPHVEFQG